jgi:hypothetical protein
MTKRWLTVAGLSAFFVLLLGIAGCSGLQAIDGSSLQNSMGGNSGPGSGKWKPRAPQNANQCGEFRGVLTKLTDEGNELATRIDTLYVACYDEDGNLLVTADKDACVEPMRQMMLGFRDHYVDFIRGADTYGQSCAQAEEEEPDPPKPPKKTPKGDPKEPKPKATVAPKDDPPDTEGPGGDDDYDPNENCPPWCCLTCLNNIDMNYTIVEGPITLPGQ